MIFFENPCWPCDASTQIEPRAMGKNILNQSQLVPHLELTKPQPKRHKIQGCYHTDILYPCGDPAYQAVNLNVIYISVSLPWHSYMTPMELLQGKMWVFGNILAQFPKIRKPITFKSVDL